MSRQHVINHLKITYNRLTYEERLEIRTWINGQYDFSEKDTSEEDPKINIQRRGKEGPEGPRGEIGETGVIGKIGKRGLEY